jgi:phosphoribosylamine-glycine ligase
MMRFDGDLAETLLAIAQGRSKEIAIKLSSRAAASVVLARAVTGEYEGISISGLEHIDGTEPSRRRSAGRWKDSRESISPWDRSAGRRSTDGGRVLAVTALADGLDRAVAALTKPPR